MQDDPSTSPLTHSATLRRLLYEALDALGLDPTRVYRSVYRRIPLPPPTLGGRLVHDNAPLFWTELAAVTGDADIGLHLGEAMKPRLLDVVGYLLLSARDLEEALRSFVRFQHILSGGFAARLEVEGETARLILDINYLGYASLRQQIECLMLLFLKLLALISDDELSPSASSSATEPRRGWANTAGCSAGCRCSRGRTMPWCFPPPCCGVLRATPIRTCMTC